MATFMDLDFTDEITDALSGGGLPSVGPGRTFDIADDEVVFVCKLN